MNLSLDNAIVPTKFKEAALNPIIKKASLDHELYSCYRPISNLRFVSKATEKIVASHLDTHLKDRNLYQLFQSADRAGHSTKTALTRVHNDILRDIDDGQCVILILLDLSSAFDVDIEPFVQCKSKHVYGICCKTVMSSAVRLYLTISSYTKISWTMYFYLVKLV